MAHIFIFWWFFIFAALLKVRIIKLDFFFNKCQIQKKYNFLFSVQYSALHRSKNHISFFGCSITMEAVDLLIICSDISNLFSVWLLSNIELWFGTYYSHSVNRCMNSYLVRQMHTVSQDITNELNCSTCISVIYPFHLYFYFWQFIQPFLDSVKFINILDFCVKSQGTDNYIEKCKIT